MIPNSTTTLTGHADEMLDRVERALAGILAAETERWRRTDPSAADIVEVLRRFVRGGKRLRPTFCVWGFLGARGEPGADAVVATACALELLHAFALIHDDVMDGSATRRGRSSVHEQFAAQHRQVDGAGEARRYGEGMAILAGDLAHVLAERALLDAPREVRAHWFEMEIELTRGQALDLSATTCRTFDPAVARRVAILKSGRYTVVRPLLLGARAAGRTDLDTSYQAFGEPLGEAFQLRDDLLGAFGSSAETGKPVGDDLREGKPTYLIACAAQRVSGAGARLLRRVGSTELDAADVRRLQQLLDECGARADVEERLAGLEMEALDALDRMPVDTSVRDRLGALAAAAVWRRS